MNKDFEIGEMVYTEEDWSGNSFLKTPEIGKLYRVREIQVYEKGEIGIRLEGMDNLKDRSQKELSYNSKWFKKAS